MKGVGRHGIEKEVAIGATAVFCFREGRGINMHVQHLFGSAVADFALG